MGKNIKILALTLLTSMLLLSTLSAIIPVNAQGDATVVVLDAIGGTVALDPAGPTYSDGTEVTFTATPTGDAWVFVNWIVVTDNETVTYTDNPVTITVEGGVTYVIQANIQPIRPVPTDTQLPDLTTAAIVVVYVSGGGTTNPVPGIYALANAQSFDLTAIANSGWKFSHWVISGDTTDHGGAPVDLLPTANPYNVNHGYGYTFSYQAVFIPVESTQPPPTTDGGGGGMSNETWIIVGLVIVIVVVLIVLGVVLAKRKK